MEGPYSGQVAIASASDTRLLSPPLTPRMAAFPTLVLRTLLKPTHLASVSTAVLIVAREARAFHVARMAKL